MEWGKKLESLLRESLAAKALAQAEEEWVVPDLQSRLGGCLAAMDRLDEAEPLLFDAYAALATCNRDRL